MMTAVSSLASLIDTFNDGHHGATPFDPDSTRRVNLAADPMTI